MRILLLDGQGLDKRPRGSMCFCSCLLQPSLVVLATYSTGRGHVLYCLRLCFLRLLGEGQGNLAAGQATVAESRGDPGPRPNPGQQLVAHVDQSGTSCRCIGSSPPRGPHPLSLSSPSCRFALFIALLFEKPSTFL